MKKTICPRCSSVNEIPTHYLSRSVSCPKCKAEYSATEDRTGALTDEEKKRSEHSARSNKVIRSAVGAVLAIGMVIGISMLSDGRSRYLAKRNATASDEQEQRREKIRAEIRAKNPTQTSTHVPRTPSFQPVAPSFQRVAPSQEWYSGGTLHRSTMKEWRQASYSNRLATAADFSAKLLKEQGRSVRSMNDLRPIADALENAISEAGSGGSADTQSVSGIAAACWMLMNR